MSKITIGALLILLTFSGVAFAMTLNEIMFNPSGDEDTDEFIELFNDGTTSVDLFGWRVSDGTGTDSIVAIEQGLIARPGQYILILDPDYFDDGSTAYDGRVPPEALVVTIHNGTFGDRGLNNTTAEIVSLISQGGATVSAYTYTTDNGQGISEEKILSSDGDAGANWANALVVGGTPGGRNSVTPPSRNLAVVGMSYLPQNPPPGSHLTIMVRIANTGLESSRDSLRLYEQWNEESSGESLILLQAWETGLMSPCDSLTFQHGWVLPDVSAHTILAMLSHTDDRPADDEWMISVSTNGVMGWVVINEIMYQPEPQRSEWIELVNAGSVSWNLDGWQIGDGTSLVNPSQRFTLPSIMLLPSEYALVASDSTVFFENVPSSVPVMIWPTGTLTLNNAGDSLVLFDAHGQLVDRVDYRPSWGDADAGVSLERIAPLAESNHPSNWASSLDSTGSTPGWLNSRTMPPNGAASQLMELQPNPFSPDGDGRDDILIVRYRLEQADSRLDLKIYDVRGRLVRTLAAQTPAGLTGEVLWDGCDDRGRWAPSGLYVVYLEALGKSGSRIQTARRPVALARRS
ncbi:MAG: lamin tail domain-containing protein [bacterium]|nr:lamin tail domain-containing protein [bacterium]